MKNIFAVYLSSFVFIHIILFYPILSYIILSSREPQFVNLNFPNFYLYLIL
jgi:hypothetical protein